MWMSDCIQLEISSLKLAVAWTESSSIQPAVCDALRPASTATQMAGCYVSNCQFLGIRNYFSSVATEISSVSSLYG